MFSTTYTMSLTQVDKDVLDCHFKQRDCDGCSFDDKCDSGTFQRKLLEVYSKIKNPYEED
jgi:hypothetical protein